MSSTLEVTVIGGVGLTDKEVFTRQDPYVVLEYGQQRFRSKTDIDGGTNPAFNSTFTLSLLPGLNEVTIVIWNENVLRDNVIGSCRIGLERVLATGMEDGYFPVYNKRQHQHGSLRVILKYRPQYSASPYAPSAYPQPAYSAPPSAYPPSYPPQPYAPPVSYPPPPAYPYGQSPYPPSYPPAYGGSYPRY
ncbi:hypothetical protein CLOM_g5242 [Closterium sp. NIES-68]|nr:hypothetical protein CLOM_g5242 [Closterium sp. NIES-68]GJP58285.1 hypothetical protein CLOP_g22991 [Closterium sp. NIES-67]